MEKYVIFIGWGNHGMPIFETDNGEDCSDPRNEAVKKYDEKQHAIDFIEKFYGDYQEGKSFEIITLSQALDYLSLDY